MSVRVVDIASNSSRGFRWADEDPEDIAPTCRVTNSSGNSKWARKQTVAKQRAVRTQLCKFWRSGSCNNGDDCTFRHEDDHGFEVRQMRGTTDVVKKQPSVLYPWPYWVPMVPNPAQSTTLPDNQLAGNMQSMPTEHTGMTPVLERPSMISPDAVEPDGEPGGDSEADEASVVRANERDLDREYNALTSIRNMHNPVPELRSDSTPCDGTPKPNARNLEVVSALVCDCVCVIALAVAISLSIVIAIVASALVLVTPLVHALCRFLCPRLAQCKETRFSIADPIFQSRELIRLFWQSAKSFF